MDTMEIDKKISVPGFLGTFAYDALPPRKDEDFSLVINTEVASEPGAHWIALVKKGNLIYFLDSYGRNVKDFTFPIDFKETILKYIGDSKLKFNPSLLQQLTSNVCGEYCIYFIQELHKGGLVKALSVFSDFPVENDKLVVDYVNDL